VSAAPQVDLELYEFAAGLAAERMGVKADVAGAPPRPFTSEPLWPPEDAETYAVRAARASEESAGAAQRAARKSRQDARRAGSRPS
jgi:hypothetical protein